MKIGFIGLGKMGSGIVGHLLSLGHRVQVWNRSPEPVRTLVAKGAEAAATPVELVHADFLVSMLANDAAVRSVILDQGVVAAAPAGLVHPNPATISVAPAQELAAVHRPPNLGDASPPPFVP